MNANLGAIMGLDAVELVMAIEDRFDITIPDVVASQISTLGQLEAVIKRLRSPAPVLRTCPSACVYYRIRGALRAHFNNASLRLHPQSVLAHEIPREVRIAAWTAVANALPVRMPSLVCPLRLNLCCAGAVLLFGVALIYAIGASYGLTLLLAVAILYSAAIVNDVIMQRMANRMHNERITVREFIESILQHNPLLPQLLTDEAATTTDDIWSALCGVVSEQLGVDQSELSRSTRFVEDLQMD